MSWFIILVVLVVGGIILQSYRRIIQIEEYFTYDILTDDSDEELDDFMRLLRVDVRS
jgi:hypothetical protein